MAKDTYKSPVKSTKPSTVMSENVEAPVPDPKNQDVTRAEEPKSSYNSVDIILDALAEKLLQRMKAKKPEDSGSKPVMKPATNDDLKPAAKPKAVPKPKVDEGSAVKPEEKPSPAKSKSAVKPELKLSPNLAEKKTEVVPKAEAVYAPVPGCSFVTDGPGSVYVYKDWKTGKKCYTLNPWVAKQASGDNWDKIFVWFKDGKVLRPLTNEELQRYCL